MNRNNKCFLPVILLVTVFILTFPIAGCHKTAVEDKQQEAGVRRRSRMRRRDCAG